jgi:hypothetical protein
MRRGTAETRLHEFSQVMKLLEDQDHEALFLACITATRPGVRSERHLVPYVLAYDNTSLFWSLEREKFHPTSTWTSPTTCGSNWKRCGGTHLSSESLNFTGARRAWNS